MSGASFLAVNQFITSILLIRQQSISKMLLSQLNKNENIKITIKINKLNSGTQNAK